MNIWLIAVAAGVASYIMLTMTSIDIHLREIRKLLGAIHE
jgi:hypothetical protein